MALLYQAIKFIDPYHLVLGAPWQYPWSLSQYGDDAGFLSLDYMQIENYIAEPAYHQAHYDSHMRRGLFWEVLANSPPSFINEGDDTRPKGAPFDAPLPPQLESTLSFLGAMDFGAVNVVNFVVEPQFNPYSNQKNPQLLNMPTHINAQGNYARIANKLLNGLLPDLTDKIAGRPFDIDILESSNCPAKPLLPAYSGRAAYDFTTQSSVSAKSIRQRWMDPTTKQEVYCAFVFVANLCPAPSSFTLGMANDAIPTDITVARHHFDANYNTTIAAAKLGAMRVMEDVVPGYGTSVFRIGCDGWKEQCDGSGRVC